MCLFKINIYVIFGRKKGQIHHYHGTADGADADLCHGRFKKQKKRVPEKNRYKTTLLFFWNRYNRYHSRKIKAYF